jgi:hypothetical protein
VDNLGLPVDNLGLPVDNLWIIGGPRGGAGLREDVTVPSGIQKSSKLEKKEVYMSRHKSLICLRKPGFALKYSQVIKRDTLIDKSYDMCGELLAGIAA